MPGPFQISAAIHPIPGFGTQGPFQYGGDLYCFAFSDLDTITGEGTLSAYVSSDDGETWTDTGESRTTTSSNLCFGSCLSTSGDYVYVLYVGDPFAANLYVVRFNLTNGTFDADSPTGPALADGAGISPGLLIEQSTAGGLGIMTKTFSSGDARVSLCTLDAALTSWSSLSNPSGQTGGLSYAPYAIARGTSGRVHGFAVEFDGSDTRLLHVLVLGSGGGVGTAFDEVAPVIYLDSSDPVAAARSDGTIAVLYNAPDVGIGSPQMVASAIATSADIPSWTIETVDASTSGTEDGSTIGLIGGSDYRAVYRPLSSDDVVYSTYSSGWAAPVSLSLTVPGGFGMVITGRELTSNFGFCYTDFTNGQESPSFYFSVGGTAQAIVGIEPIPSGEKIHRTHGVTGGGLETCGTPVPVVADNTCNPVDPDLAVDAPSICVPQGYSY